jgi:methylmalonyl-CoA/ethylmalonyl-CoA epimerase
MNAEGNAHAVHLDTIGQIAVTVTDLERSRSFYSDVLGMKFLFDAGPMTFFQCGAIRFMIGTAPHPVHAGTILYFRVDDIHACYATLAAKGAEFLEKPNLVARMQDHDLWIAVLADPDGNLIGLMCEAKRDTATEAEAA